MDVAEYTNSRKICVRFNHWEVEPIVDRFCVNMGSMLGWPFQNLPDSQNSKHLGGTLSLSTASSPNSKYPDNDIEDHQNALVQSMEVDQFESLGTPTTSLSVDSCNDEQAETPDSTETPGRDPRDEPSGMSHGSEPTISLDSNAPKSYSEPAVCQKPDVSDSIAPEWQRPNAIHPEPFTQQNDLRNGEAALVQTNELSTKGAVIGGIDATKLPSATQGMPKMPPTQAASIQRDSGSSRDVDQNPHAKRTSYTGVAIHSQDILVLRWRDAGHDWPWVLEQRQKHGFDRKDAKSLSKRLTKVKNALRDAGLSDNIPLLDKVASGDVEAKQKVNALVKASRGSKHLTNKGQHLRSGPVESGGIPMLSGAGNISCTAVHRIADSLETETGPYSRATTGGKTIFADINALESIVSDTEKDCNASTRQLVAKDESPEPSELCPEDFCHYAYQVVRQEHYSADATNVQEAINAGDSAWMLCGTYDSLCRSNKAVIKEALRHDPVKPGFADGPDWTLKHETSGDGELICTVFNLGVGALRVRTKRFLRTFYDGIPPKSKIGWLSKSVYTVHKQTAKTEVVADDLFGEETNSYFEDEMVDNAIFTSVYMANEVAIDTFVKATSQHTTTKINDVLEAIQQAKHKLTNEIDMDVDLFDRELGSKRVRVRKRELRGPRNL
jgi:hypothetical protein